MLIGTLLSSLTGQMMKTLQDLLSERHHHNKGIAKKYQSHNVFISWELASQMRSEVRFFIHS